MKQFNAIVFRQDTPKIVKPVEYFVIDNGRYMNHSANLVEVARVSGTYNEIWSKAKDLVAFPIIEFKEFV